MSTKSKKFRAALEAYDATQMYSLEEGVEIVKKVHFASFDETVEAHIQLGIDPRKSDQTVRSTVVLPHGTGKTPRVVAITKADRFAAAEAAGADIVGAEEIVAKIKGGWSDFDVVVATPDMMGLIGKELGRVLGRRMPNPKAGTVSPDISKAVGELKSGKVQFRADGAVVHSAIGRNSFEAEKLTENFRVLYDAIVKARPAAAKGTYIKSIYITNTMGPSVRIDPLKVAASAATR